MKTGPSSSVAEIESLLGYTFRDPLLLEEALTHGSLSCCANYQRLEFLGDAVLGLAVTIFLYRSNPSLGSGELTRLRSANVSTEKLARACVRHNLYRFLRRNAGDLDQQVIEFENSVRKELEDESEVVYGGSSCEAPKILADIVESTAAAVYIDSNYNLDVVWKVFGKIMEPIIKNRNEHPMMVLKEHMEKQHKKIDTRYSLENSLATVEIVVVGEDLLGKASARNKKIAKFQAARIALQKLLPSQGANLDTEAEDAAASELDSPQVRHPMMILKELMEKQHKKIDIRYSLENSLATVEIVVVGDLLGKAFARNKKIATLQAARNALQKLLPSQGANLDTEAEDGAAGELDTPEQRQNDFSTAKEFAIFLFFILFIVLLVQQESPATEI